MFVPYLQVVGAGISNVLRPAVNPPEGGWVKLPVALLLLFFKDVGNRRFPKGGYLTPSNKSARLRAPGSMYEWTVDKVTGDPTVRLCGYAAGSVDLFVDALRHYHRARGLRGDDNPMYFGNRSVSKLFYQNCLRVCFSV